MLAFSVANFTLFLQPQKNVNKIQERMTAEIEFKVGGGKCVVCVIDDEVDFDSSFLCLWGYCRMHHPQTGEKKLLWANTVIIWRAKFKRFGKWIFICEVNTTQFFFPFFLNRVLALCACKNISLAVSLSESCRTQKDLLRYSVYNYLDTHRCNLPFGVKYVLQREELQ